MLEVRWRTASLSLIHKGPWYVIALVHALRHLLSGRKRLVHAPISSGGFDIVTVVYEPELLLLRLQARSLARYLDSAFDGRIIIVVNDLDIAGTIAKLRRCILPEYGRWVERVDIVPFTRLSYGLDPYNGWVFQQVLKLAICAKVRRPYYVILDAKNHAVRPVPLAQFVSAQGRGLRKHAETDPNMRGHYDACARYFGIDPADLPVMPCMPSTPFVMHTQTVRDLIAFVEMKEKRSFSQFFRKTRFMSEFLLYAVYLHVEKQSEVDRIYEKDAALARVATILPNGIAPADTIARVATDSNVIFSGLHRDVLKQLDGADRVLVENHLRHCALLGPSETLADLQRDIDRRSRPYDAKPMVRKVEPMNG